MRRWTLTAWIGLVIGLAGGPDDAAALDPTGPLDVNEAVTIALRQNAAYRQVVAGVGVAEGTRLDALAGILPGASGSYSYSKSKSTNTLKDLELEAVRNSANPFGMVTRSGDLGLDSESRANNLGFSVREDLSLPLWYRYRSAQASVQSAKFGREAAAQDLAFQVKQQFYLTLRAQDLLTVQEEDLRLARDEERRINSMFELGSVARVDVLKARVRVSDAEVVLIRQRNTVDIEKARLATLLGYSPSSRIQLAGDLQASVSTVDSSSAVDDALMRPDLLQAQEDLRSANNSYRAAVWSRAPGLFASFDWNSSVGSSQSDNIQSAEFPENPSPGDTTSTLFVFPVESDTERDGWTLRVGASVSLDAFLNMGQHKRSRSAMRQAEYSLEGKELAVQQELEESILNYRASVTAIEAAQRGVESSEEDLRLSQERYQQGLGTVLELLEAQVNLTRSRNNLVNALTGLKISEAALDKARGTPVPY